MEAPVFVPETTRRTGSVALPSFRNEAWILAPELLIACFNPSRVLLEELISTLVVTPPTVISRVPVVTAPLVELNPAETSLLAPARLLTVRENVPEAAWLVVERVAT